jgi:hypothetical protein
MRDDVVAGCMPMPRNQPDRLHKNIIICPVLPFASPNANLCTNSMKSACLLPEKLKNEETKLRKSLSF